MYFMEEGNKAQGKSGNSSTRILTKRRNVLRAIGAGAVSLGGVGAMTGEVRGDGTVKLPKYMQGDDVLVWMKKKSGLV